MHDCKKRIFFFNIYCAKHAQYRVKLQKSLTGFFFGFVNRREESITGLVLPEDGLVDALCYRPASFSKHFHGDPVDMDASLSFLFISSCFSQSLSSSGSSGYFSSFFMLAINDRSRQIAVEAKEIRKRIEMDKDRVTGSKRDRRVQRYTSRGLHRGV